MELSPETIFLFRLTPAEALLNLFVSLLCGTFIGIMYRVTYKGVNYSSNQVIAIIMLSMITALVIMVIGNNLARAFGLVGAMSIIRFRTAVKDTQDIMFIFFALAIGLACGAGMHLIAILGSLFIGVTVAIAVLINEENPKKREYLLQIYTQNLSHQTTMLEPILRKYTSKTKLINIKSIGEGEQKKLEISYYIHFRRSKSGPSLIQALNALPDVDKVNLFYDEV